MNFSNAIRELVVRITVQTKNIGGLSIIEDRLQNIRQIMTSIKDVGVFLARTVYDFGKAGANLEAMEIKFGTLARSMELGKAKLEELNKFATETPFTLSEVRKIRDRVGHFHPSDLLVNPFSDQTLCICSLGSVPQAGEGDTASALESISNPT